MGMEVVIDNAEDMCNLMCNNALPNNKKALAKNLPKYKKAVCELENELKSIKEDLLLKNMMVDTMQKNLYFRLNNKNKQYVDEIIFALVTKQIDKSKITK